MAATIKKRIIELEQITLVAICFLVIGGFVLLSHLDHHKASNSIVSVCGGLSSASYGTDTTKVYVPQTTDYNIWIHLEAPEAISFNDALGTYNPLFVLIDSKTCYGVGGDPSMSLNTWTWVNYLKGDMTNMFKVHLSQGNHQFIIAASYLSIDRMEIISSSCKPLNNGSNCVSQNNVAVTIH